MQMRIVTEAARTRSARGRRLVGSVAALLWSGSVAAEKPSVDIFRQIEGEGVIAPSDYRTAGGAPGKAYWQQKAQYRIEATLDEQARSLSGRATITYTNNSPDTLRVIWLMLDQPNVRGSVAEQARTTSEEDKIDLAELRRIGRMQRWSGGFSDLKITDEAGARPLDFRVVDSVLRLELPEPLAPGQSTTFSASWRYPLNETKVVWGRGGYECFEGPGQGGSCIFELAQLFPRVAAYSDYEGWHNKGFVGAEFSLEFGDYDVSLTVPADHVVAATGVLQNPQEVLTSTQRQRLEQARTSAAPVYVITPEEARRTEAGRAAGTKTWRFKADNVRDFAAATSRKYIWDAMGVRQDSTEMPIVMAMSFYANEAMPLWNVYSTRAIAHTVKVFGSFALPYPYPVVQAAFGPVGGMEYPMLTFIGNRPVRAGGTGALTYSERMKNGFLDNVFHEVGHNWFPMIINSDERQWEWMDEGIASFVQYQAEKLWDPAFPSRRGEPRDIALQLLTDQQSPIMTPSDNIVDSGLVAYNKTATALSILRETVLGRENFDYAFREYARRWRFKRPTPGDFFRTMEEASGVDLDWFWRGWFFSTDHVDIALASVTEGRIDTGDPAKEKAVQRAAAAAAPPSITALRNDTDGVIATDPKLQDFYNRVDRYTPTKRETEAFQARLAKLSAADRSAFDTKDRFYRFTFENRGGVIMPIVLKLQFEDGSADTVHIPAQVWRRNSRKVVWQYATAKTLRFAELDPLWQTADSVRSNNRFPPVIEPVTLTVQPDEDPPNRMRDSDVSVSPDSVVPDRSSR